MTLTFPLPFIEKERQLGTQLIHGTFARACHLLHETRIPSLASALKYALPTLFTALSRLLDKHQDELKFEALDLLSSILPNLPSEVLAKEKKGKEWYTNNTVGRTQIQG